MHRGGSEVASRLAGARLFVVWRAAICARPVGAASGDVSMTWYVMHISGTASLHCMITVWYHGVCGVSMVSDNDSQEDDDLSSDETKRPRYNYSINCTCRPCRPELAYYVI